MKEGLVSANHKYMNLKQSSPKKCVLSLGYSIRQ